MKVSANAVSEDRARWMNLYAEEIELADRLAATLIREVERGSDVKLPESLAAIAAWRAERQESED